MNQKKILHTADLHLGGRLTGLGAAGKRRAIEKYQLFIQMLGWIDQHQIDILLIAGDFFEGQCPPKIWKSVQEEFRKRPDLWIFIAPGNHDYNSIDSPYRQEGWPSNVKIFKGGIERFDIKEEKVSIYSCGFTSSFQKEAFDESCDWKQLIQGPENNDPDWINVGLFHGELAGENSESLYNPIHPKAWPKNFFSYVALGHIHKPSPIAYEGETAYAYCGAPFGSGFDETGERGFYAGSISPSKIYLDFYSLEPARFHRLEVDLTAAHSNFDIDKKIREAIANTKDPLNNYYRIYLKGPVDPNIDIDPEFIESSFEDQTAYIEIIDQSRPALDLEEEAKKNTLLGSYIRGILTREEELNNKYEPLKTDQNQRDNNQESEDSSKRAREERVLHEALKMGLKAFYEEGGLS